MPGAPPHASLVLTADRILMADYPTLLDGMLAASLTTTTPAPVVRRLLAPAIRCDGVRARRAPLGLRLVEAGLRSDGFGPDDVTVTTPERLAAAVGPETRAVLVSSGDPLGLGMNDSTMSGLGGGRPYAPLWLADIMRRLAGLKARFGFRTVLGGPGAWQLETNAAARQALGVDVLFLGCAEGRVGELARRLSAGEPVPPVLRGPAIPSGAASSILGPSCMGVVEVSRGCGLGCPFCAMAREPMVHTPVDIVVRNVRTNLAGGVTSACLLGEDFLRYGSRGAELDPGAVLALAEAVRSVDGLRLIQLDHVNVASAARFPAADLKRLRETLTRGVRHRFPWVNLGVESASGELLAANRCTGKLGPTPAGDWERTCAVAVERLLHAGFVPMLSLLFGLPGETEETLDRTRALVERFAGQRLVAFPLFLAPLKPVARPFGTADMTATHWKLLRACYALDFEWMPGLYWDNQSGAGASLARRLLVQLGGVFKSWEWRLRFAIGAARVAGS